MKLTALTSNLVEEICKTAGYTLQEVCSTIPKDHRLELEFYWACIGKSEQSKELKNNLVSMLKEAMESITPLEAARNHVEHLEDMYEYGWTTQEKILEAKKIYEDMKLKTKS